MGRRAGRGAGESTRERGEPAVGTRALYPVKVGKTSPARCLSAGDGNRFRRWHRSVYSGPVVEPILADNTTTLLKRTRLSDEVLIVLV